MQDGGPFTMKTASNCQQKFPEIYEEFQRRSFVVNFKKACASAVPMDQSFNKLGKGQGGMISFTCRNLIRHEKAKISSFLRSICHLTIQDEYTLHHEFSNSITKRDSENVKEAVDYIRNKHNPFVTEINDQMRNLVTEEHIPTETTQFSLQWNALGADIYKEYIDTRYINKSKKLFDRLPRKTGTGKERRSSQRNYEVLHKDRCSKIKTI